MKLCKLAALLFVLLGLIGEPGALADDWPQWQGPERNNVSQETGLLKSWPKDGPKLLWTFEKAGVGYSGPAVIGDRLYTMGGRDDTSCVFAIDVKSGKEIWACPIGKTFKNSYGDGPRCTPMIDGDLLYALDADGELVCVEVATGKKRWSVNLQKDLHGELTPPGFGYSESPLVDGDQVVCCPGGKDGTIAALEKKTGKVVWRSKELTDEATYSSLVIAEISGVRQYVQLTHKIGREGAIVGIAAKDGKLLWYYPRSGYQTVIPTPIVRGNLVYAAAGYRAGCDLLEISGKRDKFEAKQLYAKKKTMNNKHAGLVLVGNYVYGYSDGPGWICQNFKTGETKWDNKIKVEKGSLTCADGFLYCYGESSGTVSLVEASPDAMKVKGTFKIPRETELLRQAGGIWTHPVVANGCLYLRDQDLIFCYDIRNHRLP